MDDVSHYESRTGKLTCTSREVFDFVTDIRNFEQFIPNATINDLQAGKESCSFSVSMVGTVSFRLTRKEPFNKVVFSGDVLQKNDFSLILDIIDNTDNVAEVKVSLEAELNPMLKMMANKTIIQFLEILIREMENFRDWGNIIK
jgi:carbon monoxide dehydrogenase subunit G